MRKKLKYYLLRKSMLIKSQTNETQINIDTDVDVNVELEVEMELGAEGRQHFEEGE